ncbi:MAG: RtcB family protein [Nanoarchaeota archaeon]
MGFDINCISGESKITSEYGYYIEIKNYLENQQLKTKSIEFKSNKEIATKPVLFLKKELEKNIFRIKTKSGNEIVASGDHPFYTNRGMVKLEEIDEEDKLAINPFNGVEYEIPKDTIVLNEEDIKKIVPDRPGIIKELQSKELLPLRLNSDKFPTIAKLVGFVQGDGHLSYCYNKKRNQNKWFTIVIGQKEDLLKIKSDVELFGYSCSPIKTKEYHSQIRDYENNKREIKGKSSQMKIYSQSFSILLHALGVPKGNKAYTKISVPYWVKTSPLWIKRLYLSGLFGAELSKPQQSPGENFCFKEPSLNQNKIYELLPGLEEFLLDIKNLLLDFDIRCNKIYLQKGVINKKGDKTFKLSLKISSEIKNLINLWSKIGFEYCEKKRRLSLLALQYFNRKLTTLSKINKVLEQALVLQSNGISKSKISEYVRENNVSSTQILARLYHPNAKTRISKGFPTFNEFILEHSVNQGGDFIWEDIDLIEILEDPIDVYDFTINHSDHNFIANNFIVSNCGMRLVKTNLTYKDVQPKLKELIDSLFKKVPAGVGCEGFVRLNKQEFKTVIEDGAKWCVKNNYGWEEDLDFTEADGCMKEADSNKVSNKAIERGINQIGTLGSGNHYLEIQRVKEENIFDKQTAKKLGLFDDQIVIMFHCGSRGFGHQVATDYLRVFLDVMEKKYKIKILDRELACAPFNSPEGQDYFSAMKCGINMSFANRQVILHRIREVFSKIFNQSAESLEMHQIYDVAHNTAKLEEHKVDGKMKKLLVHRKGSTRAFPPGHKELPKKYQEIGQPVILGGSMETGSYLLTGMKEGSSTFFSTAHGSGRTMSRMKARKIWNGQTLQKDMEKRGIYVKTTSFSGLAEEAGGAYKSVDEVCETAERAGISKRVIKLIPLANVKG